MGKFHQFLTELSAFDMIMTGYFSFTFLLLFFHAMLRSFFLHSFWNIHNAFGKQASGIYLVYIELILVKVSLLLERGSFKRPVHILNQSFEKKENKNR